MQVELCLLPTEIIQKIASYTDIASLYQLSRTSTRLRSIAVERLIHTASQARIRLWIEQHGVAAHKPMDFEWSCFDDTRQRAIFTCKTDSTSLLFRSQDTNPPVIDGCTVIYRDHNDHALRMNSVAYRSSAVSVPLRSDRNIVEYRSNGSSNKNQEQFWQLEYLTNVYQDRKSVEPVKMECSLDMLYENAVVEDNPVSPSSSSTSSSSSLSLPSQLSEQQKLSPQTHHAATSRQQQQQNENAIYWT